MGEYAGIRKSYKMAGRIELQLNVSVGSEKICEMKQQSSHSRAARRSEVMKQLRQTAIHILALTAAFSVSEATAVAFAKEVVAARQVCLNGQWLVVGQGADRRTVKVPGVVSNPAEQDARPVRLCPEVSLPDGNWTHATLLLNGASFNPKIFVNGELVSSAAGGTAPTVHSLRHACVQHGARIAMEVELMSLADMSEQTASCAPTVVYMYHQPEARWSTGVT